MGQIAFFNFNRVGIAPKEPRMGNEQNDFYQEQRRRDIGPKPDMRGTMETVGLEQQGAGSSTPRWMGIVINVLAAIGGLTVIYLIIDVVF